MRSWARYLICTVGRPRPSGAGRGGLARAGRRLGLGGADRPVDAPAPITGPPKPAPIRAPSSPCAACSLCRGARRAITTPPSTMTGRPLDGRCRYRVSGRRGGRRLVEPDALRQRRLSRRQTRRASIRCRAPRWRRRSCGAWTIVGGAVAAAGPLASDRRARAFRAHVAGLSARGRRRREPAARAAAAHRAPGHARDAALAAPDRSAASRRRSSLTSSPWTRRRAS